MKLNMQAHDCSLIVLWNDHIDCWSLAVSVCVDLNDMKFKVWLLMLIKSESQYLWIETSMSALISVSLTKYWRNFIFTFSSSFSVSKHFCSPYATLCSCRTWVFIIVSAGMWESEVLERMTKPSEKLTAWNHL